jgi:hypothetical protein
MDSTMPKCCAGVLSSESGVYWLFRVLISDPQNALLPLASRRPQPTLTCADPPENAGTDRHMLANAQLLPFPLRDGSRCLDLIQISPKHEKQTIISTAQKQAFTLLCSPPPSRTLPTPGTLRFHNIFFQAIPCADGGFASLDTIQRLQIYPISDSNGCF